MSGWELKLIEPQQHDLDAASLSALESCADEKNARAIKLATARPNVFLPLSHLFQIRQRSDETIVISGDISFLHRVGYGWTSRSLVIEGNVGNDLGTLMRGGSIELRGDAMNSVASQMRGGLIRIGGNVGDYLGGPLPGRRSGMSGGRVLVLGHAGRHTGHRLRRGTIMVLGACGDGVGSDMIAGTIAVHGQVGDYVAAGMARGTLILNQCATLDPVRFTAIRKADLGITRLLAEDLKVDMPVLADKLRQPIHRCLGDRSADGMGEVWL